MSEAGVRERVPLSAWQPTVSGNAALGLSVIPAGNTSALRLDFDFKGGKGFVVARRDWARRMPSEYALHFRLRGRGPGQRSGNQARGLDGPQRLAIRHEGSAPPRALEPPHDRKPRHRVRMGSGERQRAHRARIHRNRHRGGRGRARLAMDCGLEIEDFDAGAGADGERLQRATGIRRDGALDGTGWKPLPSDRRPWISSIPPVRAISAVSSSIGSGALRPGVFGFARPTPASGGSSSTLPPVREALAATSTRRASGRDSCASICRVPARARFCACGLSSSRARSMRSGTPSRAARLEAGIHAGCIASRASGRRSAVRTERSAH